MNNDKTIDNLKRPLSDGLVPSADFIEMNQGDEQPHKHLNVNEYNNTHVAGTLFTIPAIPQENFEETDEDRAAFEKIDDDNLLSQTNVELEDDFFEGPSNDNIKDIIQAFEDHFLLMNNPMHSQIYVSDNSEDASALSDHSFKNDSSKKNNPSLFLNSLLPIENNSAEGSGSTRVAENPEYNVPIFVRIGTKKN